jgi:hypothetical protein
MKVKVRREENAVGGTIRAATVKDAVKAFVVQEMVQEPGLESLVVVSTDPKGAEERWRVVPDFKIDQVGTLVLAGVHVSFAYDENEGVEFITFTRGKDFTTFAYSREPDDESLGEECIAPLVEDFLRRRGD